jgi:putative Mg2+ transporter-C (MgtC) family protein
MVMLQEEFLGQLTLPLPIIALRLVGAALLCAVIGFEREMSNHPAGLRTNMLVGLAAAVFSLITLHLVDLFREESEVMRLDPIRLVEAVTQGVAFLAAGMIIFKRGEVQGLTTGAAMWCAASIGLCVGLGLWVIAALTAVLAFIISHLLKPLTDRLGRR